MSYRYRLLEGLVGHPHLRRLYFHDAQFHAEMHALVDGLVVSMRELAARADERQQSIEETVRLSTWDNRPG